MSIDCVFQVYCKAGQDQERIQELIINAYNDGYQDGKKALLEERNLKNRIL